MFLKQSTSAVVLVGPVLDASGVAVTTAVIGDFTLTKNGTSAAMSGNTISHSHNGHYAITLTTGNTDTIGRLTISVNSTAQAMPVFRWDICQPTVYDALFTHAVNTTGGLPAATAAITALAGSVSTYAGGDTAGTATLLTRLPSAISLSGGAVTVGTNNDKSGYSLTPTTGLGNQTANITGSVSSVTARVTANTDQWGGVTVTGMPLPTTSYTAPPSAATNATAVRTELATELARIDATISSRLATASYTTPPTVGAIADAVWDEAYNQHTTAGTFGKLMDILRKSNNVIEGTILASPTPTTTVFRISGADFPTGALEHAILWMGSGASENQNSPILTTTNNGDGTVTVTLEEALVTAPSAGDTVLIDPTSHVHAIADIQAGLATAANLLIVSDRVSYCLSALAGNCSDAQTAAETYVLSIGGNTYTVDYSGLDASGNRSTTTLTKA
ncbi:MAG TPA: hypothetical protein DC058_04170 [Planctomycetaceae bacterium]|nr:hypothetical protein [Planctomycetaceae bacterium]HBC60398.1 hypothetical protein [Planctomycetaceae bacterium]